MSIHSHIINYMPMCLSICICVFRALRFSLCTLDWIDIKHLCAYLSSFVILYLQIAVSLIQDRPGAMDFAESPVLQEFTKATDIRLSLRRTKTLQGHLMQLARQDPTVTRRVSTLAGLWMIY